MATPGKGTDFARSILEKYGWKEGKGLGRKEDGIAKALKPTLKFDNAGIGHTGISEQFTSRWWEQAYNKVARNITVVKNEENIEVKRDNPEDLLKCKSACPPVSTYCMMDYNTFVKSSGVIAENDVAANSTQHISDEEIFRVCGGRTVHKGARHGLKLNGKLARIQRQEEQLLQTFHDSPEKTCYSYQVEESKTSKVSQRKQDNVQEIMEDNLILHEKQMICHSVLDVNDSFYSCKKKKKRPEQKMAKHSSDTVADVTLDCTITSTLVSDGCIKKLKSKKKNKENKKNKEPEENEQPASVNSSDCSTAFPTPVSDVSIVEQVPKERRKKRKEREENNKATDPLINYSVKDLFQNTEKNKTEQHKRVKKSKRKNKKVTYELHTSQEDPEHTEVSQEINSASASFTLANHSSFFQKKISYSLENSEKTLKKKHKKAKHNH